MAIALARKLSLWTWRKAEAKRSRLRRRQRIWMLDQSLAVILDVLERKLLRQTSQRLAKHGIELPILGGGGEGSFRSRSLIPEIHQRGKYVFFDCAQGGDGRDLSRFLRR